MRIVQNAHVAVGGHRPNRSLGRVKLSPNLFDGPRVDDQQTILQENGDVIPPIYGFLDPPFNVEIAPSGRIPARGASQQNDRAHGRVRRALDDTLEKRRIDDCRCHGRRVPLRRWRSCFRSFR